MKHLLILLVFLFGVVSTTTVAENSPESRFIPNKYDIELTVLLPDGPNVTTIPVAGLPIPGRVQIRGFTTQNTSILKLDAKEMGIVSVNVSRVVLENPEDPEASSKLHVKIPVKSLHLCKSIPLGEGGGGGGKGDDREMLTIETVEELHSGDEVIIYVEYVAKCHDSDSSGRADRRLPRGLLARLQEEGSEEEDPEEDTSRRWLIWTKLGRRGDASRVFPCVDDPTIRATMQLEVTHRLNYTVVSHKRRSYLVPKLMNGKSLQLSGFPRSPKMPLYSFGMVMGDLVKASVSFGRNYLPLNIYWPKHEGTFYEHEKNYKLMASSLTADTTRDMMTFLEGYFGGEEEEDVSNLELAAIGDSHRDTGATLGLVIGKTNLVLKRPGESEQEWLLRFTRDMSEFLPRLWLGGTAQNMVLNEGLSRFLYYKLLRVAGFSAWQVESLMMKVLLGIEKNSKKSRSLVVSSLIDEVEEEGKEEAVRREGGAALMRTLESLLTARERGDVLRSGIQLYQELLSSTRRARDTTGVDFAAALERAAREAGIQLPPGLEAALDYWTNHTCTEEQPTTRPPQPQWPIPASILTPNTTPTPKFAVTWHVDGRSPVLQAYNVSAWVVAKISAASPYRAIYLETILDGIITQLETEPNVFAPLSRARLWDDYFYFYSPADYPTLLRITGYLDKEDSLVVWSTFLYHFEKLISKFSSHPQYPLFKKYFQKKLDGGLKSVGVDVAVEALSFSNVVIPGSSLFTWACRLEAPSCINYAKGLLASYASDPTRPLVARNASADATCEVYCAMTIASGDDFVVIEEEEEEEEGNANTTRFGSKGLKDVGCQLKAFACTPSSVVMEGLLREALRNGSWQNEELFQVLVNVANNSPTGRALLLDWLTNHFDTLSDGLASLGVFVSRVGDAAEYWSTQEQLEKFEAFVTSHKAQFDRDVLADNLGSMNSRAAESIRNNIRWMNSNGVTILAWLEAHQ